MKKKIDTSLMSGVEFIRHYMGLLNFNTDDGGFDWHRGAKFFGIRYELLTAMGKGSSPILKRERDVIAKKADLALGFRLPTKRDARTVEELNNARIGRYLRTLRERLFLVGVDGVSKNQGQMAALMDVSIGAVQAWEYGRTRIPNARLEQFLQIVGADTAQAVKAWVMLGEMPAAVQEAIGEEDAEALELLAKLIERCAKRQMESQEPQRPEFFCHKQEQAWMKEQGFSQEAIEEAAAAPKPRGE